VTGAGKTEMIYQLLAQALEAGQHVCLTSPRVDVCIEIHSRLKRDFNIPMKLLYANGESYAHANLIVCTVNQLMRFFNSFDLIIVDEVDAFPLVNNSSLMWAIEHAKKQSARTIYLTATPTKIMQEKVKSGELVSLVLAQRFHGQPLVLPKFIWSKKLLEIIQKKKLPRNLKQKLIEQRLTGYPLLIFVPEIELGLTFQKLLQQTFANETIGFISSQSEERKVISQDFKSGKYTILIATTVLERGVTFPKVDCFVIASHHQVFTTESLVQIAGRVGRDFSRPTGQLLLFHQGKSRAMVNMKKNIEAMNWRKN
jgi:competence protein ComFA